MSVSLSVRAGRKKLLIRNTNIFIWLTKPVMRKLLVFILIIIALQRVSGQKPAISFYCELNSKEFTELFADTSLINQLTEMKAGLKIGLPDLSPGRAEVVKRLNNYGIPLVAWLLLPEDQGYWFNAFNGDKAAKRYEEFLKWTAEYNLSWKGIGIDLEPDMNDIKLVLEHPLKLAWKVYKRLYDTRSFKKADVTYGNLLSKMKSDGYTVESYIIPLILEDRKKDRRSFQRLAGIIDLKTETEIPMAYTSVMGSPAIIPRYHEVNMPIALGSTGGGVNIGGLEAPALSWEELDRDILIASGLTGQIAIFSLEGSWKKGFIPKISSMDFTRSAPDISDFKEKQERIDKIFRFVLFVTNWPLILTLVIISVISAIAWGLYRLIIIIIRK